MKVVRRSMDFLGFYGGNEGYEIYKNMHHSPTNRMIHGIFMPCVSYAILYGIPAMIYKNYNQARRLTSLIYLFYLFYYLSFDFTGGVLAGIIYAPCLIWYPTSFFDAPKQRSRTIRWCWLLFIFGLLVQELIGHSIYEQRNSDLTVLSTSILIAPLFGARAIFGIV